MFIDEMQDLGPDDVSRAVRRLPRDPPAAACRWSSSAPGCRTCRRCCRRASPTASGCSATPASTGSTGPPPTPRCGCPARDEGADFTDDALAAMYDATGGYPYFVQAYGKAAWDVAPRSPITDADVAVAAPEAEAELAVGFFGSRYERATPAEREYLRAMAERRRRRAATDAGAHGARWPSCSAASRSRCHRRATRCSRRGWSTPASAGGSRSRCRTSAATCAQAGLERLLAARLRRARAGGSRRAWRCPAATPALIERVEPNCAIEQTTRGRAGRRRDSPVASCPNSSTHRRGQRDGLQRHRRRAGCRCRPRVAARPRTSTSSATDGDVPDVLVPVGHHRPAPVPPPVADDDHLARPGTRWRCARPSRCSGRAASSRWRRRTRAGGCRGRRRSPRAASSGSGRRRCAGRRRRSSSGSRRGSSGHGRGCGPTPTRSDASAAVGRPVAGVRPTVPVASGQAEVGQRVRRAVVQAGGPRPRRRRRGRRSRRPRRPRRPSSRSASTAVSAEPPVVEVSSTASTRRPATSGPSMRRCRPCCFSLLRTTKASSRAAGRRAASRWRPGRRRASAHRPRRSPSRR